MKKIYAINGSPRKNGNTATLCKKFLEGAESSGQEIETKLINLYDLTYTGCISCFGCKRKAGNTYGKCVCKDDLKPVLEELSAADGILFGSPIYFGDITGQMRSFFERLLFPFHTYELGYKTVTPKRMPISMIYTMNVTEEQMLAAGYDKHLSKLEKLIEHIFTNPELLYSFNTYQFKNYDDYIIEIFSEAEKAQVRKNQFPIDCENAFLAGKAMCSR